MRIKKIHLLGLAALAGAGAAADEASATDRTISTATTAPVTTSQPEPPGNVTPGDITVATGGSVLVGAGQAAVTVDSSNDVTNQGTIGASNANNSVGIRLTGGNTGNIVSSGSLLVDETYQITDTDNDGDLDGLFATGSNRVGLELVSGAAFTGDITLSGVTRVEGNLSSGILLNAQLIGDLTTSGLVSVTGDDSAGIAISNGGVTGDVIIRSGIVVAGENTSGLVVNAPIGGELRVNGTWSATGFHSVSRPADVSHFDADDLLIGGSAILIHSSIAGGVTIEGVGVEDDLDDDGDGLLDDGNDNNDDTAALVTAAGSAPAIHIQALPAANITLGTVASDFGLHVRGAVNVSGVYDGVAATAIRVEGDSGGATVTITGGAALDSTLSATAFKANSVGLYIGQNATLPQILTRRSLSAAVRSDVGHAAQTIVLAAGANAPSLNNSGLLLAQHFGGLGDATVVTDLSNTLGNITNSGTIRAQVVAVDDDPTDSIPPPPVTGSATAFDLAASSIAITLNQVADTPFNDDDMVDNDASSRPAVLIEGDILFGSGADTLNLLAGEINGDISFGAGADTFFIDNGAEFHGRLTDTGALSIDVADGVLGLEGGTTNLTTAHVGADGDILFRLSTTPSESALLLASGNVTFDPGARLIPVVPVGLPNSGTQTILTASGGLTGAANVTGVVTGSGAPFLYNLTVGVVSGDPNSLEAAYIMKTPAQLGLNANQSSAFSSMIAALQTDSDASTAIASLQTSQDFFDAYSDLMPTYASGAAELAATAIQQGQSATSNRLAATRLHDLDEVSVWAQEIGYALERTPATTAGQEFSGQGFGIALGIDGPLDNGAIFGLSGSFIASDVKEPNRPDGEISAWFGQANAYLGAAMGPIDLDFVVGAGVGKLQSRRFVEIGDSFSALSEADWWAYEGHGAVRASAPMSLGAGFVLSPQAALTYAALSESSYEESGGGSALDYEADDALSQRLWGDAGIELSANFRTRGNAIIAPRIYAGYRANLIDEATDRTFRYLSAGSEFTLTDESLGDGAPLVGIGLDASNGYSTITIGYEGEFGDQVERHSLNASVRFRF